MTLACGEGKYIVYGMAPRKENDAQNPFPSGFQGRDFQDSVREPVTGYVISWWVVLRLVDGELTE